MLLNVISVRMSPNKRNANKQVEDGLSALYEALLKKSWEVIERVLRQRCRKSKSCNNYFQLLIYILSDDVEGAESLKTIVDVDFKDLKEPTPLRFAVMKRNLQFVKILLNRGADPNIREFRGVRTILADILPDFKKEFTPEIIQLLLQRGARVNDVRDENNCSALEIAAMIHSAELLKLLIPHGLDFSEAESAMWYALIKHNCEFVELLLQNGMDPNRQNYQGVSWLVQAIWANSPQMVEIFIKFGANLDAVQLIEKRQFPLHFACFSSDAKMLNVLLKYRPDLRVATSEGDSLLHYAAINVYTTDPLEILLKMNFFNVNYQNKKGESALHGVSYSGSRGSKIPVSCWHAELLLRFGAKIDVEDRLGLCPNLLRDCKLCDICPWMCPVVMHFQKLELLNYKLNCELQRKIFGTKEELVYQKKKKPFHHFYQQELEQLKNVVVCYSPRYNLFDMLFMNNKDLIKFAENEVIMDTIRNNDGNFEKRYQFFGFILNRVCVELERKNHLLIPAREKFCDLVGKYVPVEIAHEVFSYLSNNELNTFCQIDLN